MSPRTGRPKIEDPKCNDVKVRLTQDMTQRLDSYCAEHGLTRAEAIRQGISLLLESK